ncbi:hypothetical protein K438DRAFT_1630192, partial [Mycena galopus ATCC 62051]
PDLFTAVVTGHHVEDTDTSRTRSLNRSMVVAGLLGGEVYVAETVATGKIVGCAVWFGPGRGLYDSPDQRQHSLEPFMASLDEELRAWWATTFLPKYDTFVTSALGEGTKLAAWHLQTLGVDPAYHRQGVAKLLVNIIVEKARASQPHTALCVECATVPNVCRLCLGFLCLTHCADRGLYQARIPFDAKGQQWTGFLQGNAYRRQGECNASLGAPHGLS